MARGGLHNVVSLALASAGALMLMAAYLRWIDHIQVVWGALRR